MSDDKFDDSLKNNKFDNETNAFKSKGLKRTPQNAKYTPLFDFNDDKIKSDNFFKPLHDFPPLENPILKPLSSSPTISNTFKISDTDNITQRKKSQPTNINSLRIELNYEIFQNDVSIELDSFSINIEENNSQANFRRIIESSVKNSFSPSKSLNVQSEKLVQSQQNQTNEAGVDQKHEHFNLHFGADWSLSENMAIPIKDITELIKEYKGEEKELNTFIKNIDKLWNHIAQYDDHDKTRFLLVLQLKITEKAAEATKNVDFESWEIVKKALKENINPQKNIEKAELKLSTVKQNPKEDTETYAKRVEELLENLNKSMDLDGNNEIIKNQNDRKARKARKSFEQGLADQNLKKLVINRGTKTLKESIDYIVEQELRQFELNEKYCTICNSKQHSTAECRNNQKNKFESKTNQNNKFCTFCQRKYHDISECRTLQMSRMNTTNISQSDTAPRNSNIICYKCNSPGHLASACFQRNNAENSKNQTYESKPRTSNNESKTPPQNSPRRTRNDSDNGRMRLFEAETVIEDISDEENLN